MKKNTAETERRKRTKQELVESVIRSFEDKLDSDEVKVTAGDLIRLLQLHKELSDEENAPQEIKVQWVDEPASDK